MPSLLLVRHGQASFGAADYDVLSELGARQARATADELLRRGVRPARIVAGGLRRQQDTAAPIAEALGVPVGTDPGWDEYDSGDFLAAHSASDARLGGGAALSSREFQAVLEDGVRAWMAAGEDTTARVSWPAFRARTGAALRDALAALGPGETGIAVTSAGVLAALCSDLLGAGPETYLRLNRVAVNAAVTKVVSGRGGSTLVAFNDHAHLELGESLVTYR
jgi:broad specificity phosphatase PhoE